MIISIASGKGGTGKTTVAVNLALSLPKGAVQLIDCDVEEPNSHLFLSPSIHRVTSVGIPVPRIDESKCTYCVVGKIPYESKVVEALVHRKSVMNYPCNEVQGIVQRMWDQVEAVLIQ